MPEEAPKISKKEFIDAYQQWRSITFKVKDKKPYQSYLDKDMGIMQAYVENSASDSEAIEVISHALLIAVKEGHLDLVTLFIDTPGINLEVVEVISNKTALALAIANNDAAIANLLIAKGAKQIPGQTLSNLTTQSIFATPAPKSTWTEKKFLEAVEQGLLDKVVDYLRTHPVINISDEDGETPLLKAVKTGHYHIVEALLQYEGSLDMNKADKEGNTALHWAALTGHTKITKLCLQSSKITSMDKKNNEGLTPYEIAKRNENTNEACFKLFDNETKSTGVQPMP